MRVGSLFTGIGGFDLGLERAGMRVVWQCESDPFCQRVLARHWPGVPCYPDVTRLAGADVESVDVLCGGFPCQGLSNAGLRLGLLDPRSGLWSHFARLIGELRPRYVLVENVAALLARGLGRVLGDLAALRYDAEWDCLPASAFGAPHQRDRVWLIAYPGGDRVRDESGRRDRASGPGATVADDDGPPGVVADTEGEPVGPGLRAGGPAAVGRGRPRDGGRQAGADADRRGREIEWLEEPQGLESAQGGLADRLRDVGRLDDPTGPDADGLRQQGPVPGFEAGGVGQPRRVRDVPDANGIEPRFRGRDEQPPQTGAGRHLHQWAAEPDVGRVADGVPARVDRLRGLGNALVPQIAEWLGQQIMTWEAS